MENGKCELSLVNGEFNNHKTKFLKNPNEPET